MKKAEGDPMKFLIGALVLLIVAVILLSIYNGWFSNAKGSGDTVINLATKDCDGDNIKDIVDPCVCETSGEGCSDSDIKCEDGCK